MIPVSKFIKDLKHLALERQTYYDNNFPSNCGEINPDGSISFDCIGMIKSYINEPAIAYKTEPAGYYVKPGQVIPDATVTGILYLCTDVSGDFTKKVPGEYLKYDGGENGHAGVYVGEFTDPSGICNTIECTTDFGGGVTTSYCDDLGNRWNHKGGVIVGRWIQHGKLSKYIDYNEKPEVKTKRLKIVGGYIDVEEEDA